MPIGHLAHTHMPYCIQKTKDGKWLVLNRNYKPLGVVSKDWVDYDNHPDSVSLDHRSLAVLKRVAVYEIEDQPDDPGILYFYKDGQRIADTDTDTDTDTDADTDADWTTYAEVLQLLGRAKVK